VVHGPEADIALVAFDEGGIGPGAFAAAHGAEELALYIAGRVKAGGVEQRGGDVQ
jgi:hypothetical protein